MTGTKENDAPMPPQMSLSDQGARTTFANWAAVTFSAEELVVGFGLIADQPSGGQVVQVSDRIVCTFYTAKRLLMLLEKAVERHEQDFGVLELDPMKRLKQPLKR